MPELVLPDVKYKKSFLTALREYKGDIRNANRLKSYSLLEADDLSINFEKFVLNLENESKGINLPDGFVPHTVYWLVEGDEFLGRADIRHELNDFLLKEGGHIGYDIRPSKRGKGYGKLILKLAIEKAHELGLTAILVTCDASNIASDNIIRSNGGALEDQYQVPDGEMKNRYWIKGDK